MTGHGAMLRTSRWALASVLLAALGCAAEDEPLTPTGGDASVGATTPSSGTGGGEGGEGGGSSDPDVLEGACPLGARNVCRLHHADGCAEGMQYCVDGLWSDCERSVGRRMKKRADYDDEDAVICGAEHSGTTENVCDPECQAYAPAAPDFNSGSGPSADWETGNLGELPAGALDAGLEEPCGAARDCQFDHYCAGGTCAPMVPGQLNPACTSSGKMDVSVGIPCGDTLPLCNRGPVALLAEDINTIEVKWRAPQGSQYWMDSCSLGSASGSCTLSGHTEDLAPGECINVSCGDIPDNHIVFVDAGNGNSEECECGNNWTFNTDGACGAPSCGGSIATADEVPVTMLIAMDDSASMTLEGNPRRLTVVKNAMESFVTDPASTGLGVVLRFWPANTWSDQSGRCTGLETGSSANRCDATGPFIDGSACAKHPCNYWTGSSTGPTRTLVASCHPEVQAMCNTTDFRRCCNGSGSPKRWDEACAKEFDRRTGGACSACNHPSLPRPSSGATYANSIDDYHFTLPNSAVRNAITNLDSVPYQHWTPSLPALQGVIDYCDQYQDAHPGEKCVVVFATDGDPRGGCNNSENTIENAAAIGASNDVLTYVVGIEGSNESFMDDLAAAGGTYAAYILGGGAAGEQDLLEALNNIRNTFACSYAVPDGTAPELLSVDWNEGGTSTALQRVDDVTACGGVPGGLAYYYSDDLEQIILCSDACEVVKASVGSNMQLRVACAAAPAPVSHTDEFSAAGRCDEPGTYVKWTVLLYEADVPPGSSIIVEAQTRFDASSSWPDDDDWTVVETIVEANESNMSEPTVLSDTLGPAVFAEEIRLRLTSTVEGGAPTLHSYEVQFTCADTE